LSPLVDHFDSQRTIERQARVSGALPLLKSTMLNINKYIGTAPYKQIYNLVYCPGEINFPCLFAS